MELRDAVPSDAKALAMLHIACWRETYTGILPHRMISELSVDARAAAWTRILDPAGGGSRVWLAEDEGRLVGFGSCGAQRDASLKAAGFGGEISAIYILRSHQGKGLGRTIMQRMAASLRASGYDAATLWVLRENLNARLFYERLGAVVVAEKEDERADEARMVELAYGWRRLDGLAVA